MRSFHPRVSLRMRRWIVETPRSTGIERRPLGDAKFRQEVSLPHQPPRHLRGAMRWRVLYV